MSIQRQLSREPSDYHPGGEFVHRKRERDIPGGAIQECIQHGDVKKARDGRVKMTATHRGEEYTLIIDPDDRAVITGYRERNYAGNDCKHSGFAD